jgi:protoheme IX farnesyltransferase
MSRVSRTLTDGGPHDATAAAVAAHAERVPAFGAVIELTKPGIVRMVLVAASVGFALGLVGAAGGLASGGGVSLANLVVVAIAMLIGTALAAGGANALNMALEVWRDAQMERTASRPIPSGRLSKRAAIAIGLGLSFVGVAVLWAGAGLGAALVTLSTVLLYVIAYTPLKPVTTFSTLVGALPGALPPLVGWCAASTMLTGSWSSGLTESAGWSLFALMFVWQVPHVMAISWKYRDEYVRGGHRVLPSVDPTGERTGRAAVAWSVLLVPVSFAPALFMPAGVVGFVYLIVAGALGMWTVAASANLLRERTTAAATKLFVVTIIYLPVVLLVLVGDALTSVLRAGA